MNNSLKVIRGKRTQLKQFSRQSWPSAEKQEALLPVIRPILDFLLRLEHESYVDLGRMEEPLADLLDNAESLLERGGCNER